ncbi:Uma2 family endonuclease [Trichothermofontia sp.]
MSAALPDTPPMTGLPAPTALSDTGDLPPWVVLPPTDLDSDEPELESYQHLQQLLLLLKCLDWLWRDRTDYFAAGNLTIYYSARKLKTEDFRGPDFFVVLDTEKRPRKSWMVWEEEGKYPNVIVELLSYSTANQDRGSKKQIYQDIFRTPDYFWFDPHSLEFAGFHLVNGVYAAIAPTEQGWLWSKQLGLYLGVYQDQLRFFTSAGELVPTPEESAIQEQQKVEQERQRAAAEHQRAEQERQRSAALAAKLRELGIDPDEIS